MYLQGMDRPCEQSGKRVIHHAVASNPALTLKCGACDAQFKMTLTARWRARMASMMMADIFYF
jgi:hypothetical protein